MEKHVPKIEASFSEIELLGTEVSLRRAALQDGGDDPDGGSVTVIIDPDPGVTETITCTEMVCSSARFVPEEMASFEARFVLPAKRVLPETVTVKMRSNKKI